MTLLSELWDTTRMRLLVEIDRRGSLSAAAQAIGIGQPSASQHLRTLETAAGQRLVGREHAAMAAAKIEVEQSAMPGIDVEQQLVVEAQADRLMRA